VRASRDAKHISFATFPTNSPRKSSSDIKEDFKAIFKTASIELAGERKQLIMDKYGEDKKVATACKILDEGFEDAMQVMVLPENIRQRLRTTNVLERLNEEVRRRERVVRIFPNCDSVIRIIGALLMEKDDEWTSAPRKYLEFDRNEI
jgi:putative transposase